jgi:hypothetical protein
MGNQAKITNFGIECPVKNCPKKHNRRFSGMGGLCKHLIDIHPGYLEKKLNIKLSLKPNEFKTK